ncbi:MAG: DNA methyltransferase [Chloroflexota bacterium]
MPTQLPLFPATPTLEVASGELVQQTFSHNGVGNQTERIALEKHYAHLLEETNKFNRKLVSYQGNKGALIHGWIKYREGFSAQLVEGLIREFHLGPSDTILDPFAGSATTLLVAKSLGIDAVGLELLPVCHVAWQAKSRFQEYDLAELRSIRQRLVASEPVPVQRKFPHVTITEGAFCPEVEDDVMFYTEWFESLSVSEPARVLGKLLMMAVLEDVSFTRKDGQFLRWDYRSSKTQQRNEARLAQGKEPVHKVDKGPLPTVKEALIRALDTITADIQKLQTLPFKESRQQLLAGNTLLLLSTMSPHQFTGVITSPPYCNRYDYTRTYALELAYLGVGEGIYDLRQSQLSCTVESRSKLEWLEEHYNHISQLKRFEQIRQVVQTNPVFREINESLQIRWQRGELNNRGVLPMVEQYFTELTFVFAEVLRTCRPGACVAFVNDNVRYGGEVIPVDLLTTNLAEELGFEPVKVYVLPQRKGNSSQQMGRFGRQALRKSITIWRKLIRSSTTPASIQ